MSVRKILPVLLLIAVGLGVLGFVLMTGGRSEEEIEQAAILHVREKLTGKEQVEGRDFTIGVVEILSESDGSAVVAVAFDSPKEGMPPEFLLELGEEGGEWRVKGDLRENFKQVAMEDQFIHAVGDRLKQLYRDRFRIGLVNIRDGTTFFITVSRSGRDVAGYFKFRFSIPRRDGKFVRGVYTERFLYKDGKWEKQGKGQLLEGHAPR